MLTAERLREIVEEHFAAENSRDVQAIVDTVDDHVEYHVKSPSYPDDSTPFGVTSGSDGVRKLWENMYDTFTDYRIVLDDVLTYPDRNQAFALVTITATPKEEFEGLPAGKPFRYSVAALCDYNDEGLMTRETVYGNMAIVIWGLRRMHQFLDSQEKATS
jgi:predicted ester cyclase